MKSEGLHIGVDVDEVLATFTDTFVDYHNGMYGTNLSRASFVDYHYAHALNTTPEDATRKVMEFYASNHFKNILPVPGSVKGIEVLKDRHLLSVVTSRSPSTKEDTEEWLLRHYQSGFSEVHFAFNIYGKFGGKRKVELCQDLGIDVLVEDSLDYAQDCAKLGIPVLLLDLNYPWNQGETAKRITRVKSWEEITHRIQNGQF